MLICLIFTPLLFNITAFQEMIWNLVGSKIASNEGAIKDLTNMSAEEMKSLIKKAAWYLIMGLTIIPFVISLAAFIYLPLDEGFQKSCEGQNIWLMSFLSSLGINLGIMLLSPSLAKYIFIKGMKDNMKEEMLKKLEEVQNTEIPNLDCISGVFFRAFKYLIDERNIFWCNICYAEGYQKVTPDDNA